MGDAVMFNIVVKRAKEGVYCAGVVRDGVELKHGGGFGVCFGRREKHEVGSEQKGGRGHVVEESAVLGKTTCCAE